MARMIDRDVLTERLRGWLESPHGENVYNSGYDDAIRHVLDVIDHMPTLTPPNEPLTLEELREMDGAPVWIKRIGDEDLSGDGWAIVEGPRCLTWFMGIPMSWEIRVWWPGSEVEDCPKYENYSKTWIAYRRTPEGEA